jgi:hypothetical protein
MTPSAAVPEPRRASLASLMQPFAGATRSNEVIIACFTRV